MELTPTEQQARLNAYLEFWKFVLGSVALVALTTVLGHLLKSRELKLKEADQRSQLVMAETDNLGKYIDKALTEDLTARMRFAQYFSKLTSDDAARGRWDSYYETLVSEHAALQKLEQQKNVATAKVVKDGSPEARQALQEVTAKFAAAQVAALPLAAADPLSKVNIFTPRKEDVAALSATLGSLKTPTFTVGQLRELEDDTRPGQPEIRYFDPADSARAVELADVVRQSTALPEIKIKKLEDASVTKPGYFELWVPKASIPQLAPPISAPGAPAPSSAVPAPAPEPVFPSLTPAVG